MERVEIAGRGRHYEHPTTGHKMPSVTNILSVINRPALIPWAAKVERELCINTAQRVYASLNGDHVSADDFNRRLDFALPKQKAHKLQLTAAGDIGTEAHALIEWRLRGELGLERGPEPQTSEPALWAVAAFEDWRREVKLKPEHAELRLWSEELDAAGSTDLMACEIQMHVLGPDKRCIKAVTDFKTGKKLYDEAQVQVAAYWYMGIERGYWDDKTWGLLLRLPKTLDDPKFEALTLQPSQLRPLVEVFKAARKIWAWQNA